MRSKDERRQRLEADRERRRRLHAQEDPSPERDRIELSRWLLMGLPDPRPDTAN
jgi:hypothetical protein